MKNFLVIFLLLFCFISGALDFGAIYKKADSDYVSENFAGALKGYESIIFDPASEDFPELGDAFSSAVDCLKELGNTKEFDSLLEKALKIHPDNWHLLLHAATKLRYAPCNGNLVDGRFERMAGDSSPSSSGNFTSSERDRFDAINLCLKAISLMAGKASHDDLAEAYLNLANVILADRNYWYPGKLMSLTDLTKRPGIQLDTSTDDDSIPLSDKDGNPVFFKIPESFESAQNDGERLRWAISMAEKKGSKGAALLWGDFLYRFFGAESLRSFSNMRDQLSQEKGEYSLYSLSDEESIAKFGNSVRRFKMPDDSNFIKIYKKAGVFDRLAYIYTERRQLEKAELYFRKHLAQESDEGRFLAQITESNGELTRSFSQIPGRKAKIAFKYRNAREIKLSARRINIGKILEDFKSGIISGKGEPDLNKMISENLDSKYLGELVPEWNLKLNPSPHHWLTRTFIETPLTEAGAYLLEGRIENGNTVCSIIWLSDLILIWVPGDKRNIFIVCDAATGAPLPDVNVEVFSFRKGIWDLTMMKSDSRGIVTADDNDDMFKLIIAGPADGSLVFLGPSGTLSRKETVHKKKDFCITDRPVYRPGDTVKCKIWSAWPVYAGGKKDLSEDKAMDIDVHDSDGNSIAKHTATPDKWGGIDMEFRIPENAKPGNYDIGEMGRFRVEEYKKPEFELLWDLPKTYVKTGDKFTATLTGRYCLGALMANGKVKYTVTYGAYAKYWIPKMPWTWLYGEFSGYFADFIPECRVQSDLKNLSQQTGDTRPVGTLNITVDTLVPGKPSGDNDYVYKIDAEVTDAVLGTVCSSASVVASVNPFKVFLWSSYGYFNSGDTVNISAASKTATGIPVPGKGTVKLFKITYDKNGKSLESLAGTWPLDIGKKGETTITFKDAKPGQFKLVYTVTDSENNSAEGVYSFTVFGDTCSADSFKFKDLELFCNKAEYRVGEDLDLMITSSRKDAYVYLFVGAKENVSPPPELIKLNGHTALKKIKVEDSDTPNFFIQALSVSEDRIFTADKEILVPPEQKVLNVEVLCIKEECSSGEKAQFKIKITDSWGKPVEGQVVVTIYDKSIEYISGGSNVPPIRPFFWKRLNHHQYSLNSFRHSWNIPDGRDTFSQLDSFDIERLGYRYPIPVDLRGLRLANLTDSEDGSAKPVLKYFKDTVYWTYGVVSDKNGEVLIDVAMPEKLTIWKVKAWVMASDCRVGEGQMEMPTPMVPSSCVGEGETEIITP